MDQVNIQAWLALYSAAMLIGEDVYAAVKNLAAGKLTPEELVLLEAAWNEDVQRSAANAGISAEPDTPLPPAAPNQP